MTRRASHIHTVASTTPPCPVCGLEYAAFRGWHPGGFKGPLSGHKRGAWELHVENCEDYRADAGDFDPSSFGALDPNAALAAYVVSLDADDGDAWGVWADEPAPVVPVLGAFDLVPLI